MNKKLLGAILLVTLSLTGCKKNIKPSETNKVVAETEKSKLTIDELYEEVKTRFSLSVLLNEIDTALLEKTLQLTDEDKNNEGYFINTRINQQKEYFNSMNQDNQYTWTMYLESQGFRGEKDFRDYLSLEYRRNLNATKYARTLVTEKEINDYYKKEAIGDMSAKHILIAPVKDQDQTSDEQAKAKEAALKKAKEVIQKLEKGEKWDDLAKTYSDDKKEDGGNLGWFKQGAMVKPFEEATCKLKLNEYTKVPVESEFGYHIILKTGEKEKKELSELKESIIDTLAKGKIETIENIQTKGMIELRKKHGFTIKDKELDKQYKTLVSNVK